MTNRIRRVQVRDIRLDPLESELAVTVFPEHVTPTTEVRGRLVGPRSAYARTLEVAYPLRECQPGAGSDPALVCRVVLPEPSFWDPDTPFLYEGFVELWEEGRPVDRAEVRHGLRTRGLGPRGVRWNGRPLTLRGVARSTLTSEDAAALRQAGCNTLVVPIRAAAVWDAADRLGFVVLGEVAAVAEMEEVESLRGHPCVLGWVLGPAAAAAGTLPDAFVLDTPAAADAPRELVLQRLL